MNLIQELKENNQDFEYYPTSDRMLELIKSHIVHHVYMNKFKVLDIGCGTCKFKKYMSDSFRFEYYVFEKSSILRKQFDDDTICLGTDFYSNSLIDKNVDILFCNPPYSDFTTWVHKIISEGIFNYAYLIIPERWKNNQETLNLIKKYKLDYEILGNDTFLDAERKARAKVDIVCLSRPNIYDNKSVVVENFFNDMFNVQLNKKSEENLSQHFDLILSDIQDNVAEILVEDYNTNYNKILENLKTILKLDSEILETFGFSVKGVSEGLMHKLENMKKEYWKRILDEMESITSKLTYETRQNLFKEYNNVWSTDFTLDNIYAIVMFILKRASFYYDEQIKDFFKMLSQKENVKPYKSNQKLFEQSDWRWKSDKNLKYVLDYRIVISSPFISWSVFETKLENTVYSIRQIKNIATIANNLGFKINYNDLNQDIDTFGKKYYIHMQDGTIFMEFKNYKNKNMHVKFNQEFTKALNVTIGKLLGWLKCKEDIKEQFPEDIAKGAEKYFDNQYKINLNTSHLLPNF